MTNSENYTNTGSLIHRPTRITINLSALEANFEAIRQLVHPAKVMGVIKADGYGHGLVPCAQVLERAGAEMLGVAYIEEAIQLRTAGIKAPILVFGGLKAAQLPLYFSHDIEITASSVSKVEQIDEAAAAQGKRARVHLKIDTGLERIGVHHYTAHTLCDAALAARNIDTVGIYSHFAAADAEDQAFTHLQIDRFAEVTEYFEKRARHPFFRHLANSAGLLALQESHFDMVRPGLALYGVSPAPHLTDVVSLQPVMELKSEVVFFKVVKEGAGVSYGLTWKAPQDTRVVTVPIGYGDGYLRQLSNRGTVLIRGQRYPIVGVVCMDQMMVNIGQGTAYNGDEVVLIGTQGAERVSVEQLAAIMNTAPHELLVSLNQRIPRFYVENSSSPPRHGHG